MSINHVNFSDADGPWDSMKGEFQWMVNKNNLGDRYVVLMPNKAIDRGGMALLHISLASFAKIVNDSLFKHFDPSALIAQGFINNPVAKDAMDSYGHNQSAVLWGLKESQEVKAAWTITGKAFLVLVGIAATAMSHSGMGLSECQKAENRNAQALMNLANQFVDTSSQSARAQMVKPSNVNYATLTLFNSAEEAIKSIYLPLSQEKSSKRETILAKLSEYNDLALIIKAETAKFEIVSQIMSVSASLSDEAIKARFSLEGNIDSYVAGTPQIAEFNSMRLAYFRKRSASSAGGAVAGLLAPQNEDEVKGWAVHFLKTRLYNETNDEDERSFSVVDLDYYSAMIGEVLNKTRSLESYMEENDGDQEAQDIVNRVMNQADDFLVQAAAEYLTLNTYATLTKSGTVQINEANPMSTMIQTQIVGPAMNTHTRACDTVGAISIENKFSIEEFDPTGGNPSTQNLDIVLQLYQAVKQKALEKTSEFLHHIALFPTPTEADNNSATWNGFMSDSMQGLGQYNNGMFTKILPSIQNDLLFLIAQASGHPDAQTGHREFSLKLGTEYPGHSFLDAPRGEKRPRVAEVAGEGVGRAVVPKIGGKTSITKLVDKVRPLITESLKKVTRKALSTVSNTVLADLFLSLQADVIDAQLSIKNPRHVIEGLREEPSLLPEIYAKFVADRRLAGFEVYVDAFLHSVTERVLISAKAGEEECAKFTFESFVATTNLEFSNPGAPDAALAALAAAAAAPDAAAGDAGAGPAPPDAAGPAAGAHDDIAAALTTLADIATVVIAASRA